MTAKPKAVRKFTGHENEQPLSALKKIIDTEMQGENNLRNEKKTLPFAKAQRFLFVNA